MRNRKGSVLAMTALATGLGLLGFSFATAADDESKLHQVMEKVQSHNAFITKNLRSEANYKKNKKDIAKRAKDLADLGKSVRDETQPAKEQKKDQKDWEKLMDDYVKESNDFATAVGKDDTTQAQAKDQFKKVAATCAACHKDFRKDDE